MPLTRRSAMKRKSTEHAGEAESPKRLRFSEAVKEIHVEIVEESITATKKPFFDFYDIIESKKEIDEPAEELEVAVEAVVTNVIDVVEIVDEMAEKLEMQLETSEDTSLLAWMKADEDREEMEQPERILVAPNTNLARFGRTDVRAERRDLRLVIEDFIPQLNGIAEEAIANPPPMPQVPQQARPKRMAAERARSNIRSILVSPLVHRYFVIRENCIIMQVFYNPPNGIDFHLIQRINGEIFSLVRFLLFNGVQEKE
ncbi:unnamed protein product [Caenorhabditis bovis]|uniref:Uncharacterized protein n=1 Tax=Caenorhabditis bovis TaxID=2654633 RepID=A0A8S1FCS9_9PELO|nr:unnamed protein product [Caenorhabditis bovis]